MNESEIKSILKLDATTVAKISTHDLKGEIDKRVRNVFKLCESDSKVVRAAANETISEYLETQRSLFSSKGLNADRALKEAIVASEENGQTMYRIIPRGETLQEVDDDDGGSHVLSVAASRSYSSRLGLGDDSRRGKYNDAGLLYEQAAASIDNSEVVPFASACV